MCVCSYFLFLWCKKWRERGRESEIKRNSAYSEIKPWSNNPLQFPLQFFFPPPPCFPTFDASIVSLNLIGVSKCRRRGQRDFPLCQMRSVDISHQTRADQRPACAHAGGRIKPHHAQPPQKKTKKNAPLYTSKEIKARVKSNSRGIVKMGLGVALCTWPDLCVTHL